MYSIRNRINVVWTLTFFVLAVGAGTMAVTSILKSYIHPPAPIANVQAVVAPHVYRAQAGFTGRSVDRTLVRVDGVADFTSCFTWNTKQIFVYFVVEYNTSKYSRNEITVYDAIVTSKENAVIKLDKAIEYPTDHIEPSGMAGRPAVLRVKYHLMSYSGLSPIYEIADAAHNFVFPSTYFSP